MTDRLCIHSNGTIKKTLSTENVISCCNACGFGCSGGWPYDTYSYWVTTGIVTGGGYGTTTGCKSYPFEKCSHYINGTYPPCGVPHVAPDCVKTCDSGSNLVYEEDLTFGSSAYAVNASVEQIQKEIMDNGPVTVVFRVYDDFLTYSKGVYQYLSGSFVGLHAVRVLGWGVEDGVPYWLAANSWNEEWGDHGYFKILRGSNHLEIESDVAAGLPKL